MFFKSPSNILTNGLCKKRKRQEFWRDVKLLCGFADTIMNKHDKVISFSKLQSPHGCQSSKGLLQELEGKRSVSRLGLFLRVRVLGQDLDVQTLCHIGLKEFFGDLCLEIHSRELPLG